MIHWLAIKLLSVIIKKAEIKLVKIDSEIFSRANKDMIKSYKTTLMFLDADKKNY